MRRVSYGCSSNFYFSENESGGLGCIDMIFSLISFNALECLYLCERCLNKITMNRVERMISKIEFLETSKKWS